MTTVLETEIKGRPYTLPRMPAVKARRVLAQLIRIMGPLLDAAPRKGVEEGTILQGKSFGEVATAVLERMDDNTMESLIKDLTEGAMVGGTEPGSMIPLNKPMAQNIVWGEDEGDGLMAMFEYLKWALEVNFRSFFDALRSKGKKAEKDSSERNQKGEQE